MKEAKCNVFRSKEETEMKFWSFDELFGVGGERNKTEKEGTVVPEELQSREILWSDQFSWDQEVERANKEVFGNKEFREKQREVINATKCKRDVIALIPTGGGK